MKKWMFIFIVVALLSVIGVGFSRWKTSSSQITLHISAATSLTDAMTQIKEVYEKKHDSLNLEMNFASSGKLQQQIEQGVPVGLFLSAGKIQMDALDQKHLLSERTDLLKNSLVLITNQHTSGFTRLNDLTSSAIQKIAIGYPDTVPAGKYAKQTLESAHLWDKLKPKIVFANNVRQVLAYVETGNVEVGLVYQTDAKTTDKVKIVQVIPSHFHDPIVYPMAIIKQAEHPDNIRAFYKWLQGKTAGHIFKTYGFDANG